MILIFAASAATHVVASDGSGDFVSIQAAIDAAAAGDRIEVRDGTYLEGTTASSGFLDVGALLHIDRSITIEGESIDGVRVLAGPTLTGTSHPRTAAIQFSAGAVDVEVSGLTLVHTVDGTETASTGTYTYTGFGTSGPYDSITGVAHVHHVVLVMPTDDAKSLSYINSVHFDLELDHLTVDFGTGMPGVLAYSNRQPDGDFLGDSAVRNTDCRWVHFGSYTTTAAFPIDHTVVQGCSAAPAGIDNVLAAPGVTLFEDAEGGDYRPAVDSPLNGAGSDGDAAGAFSAAGDCDALCQAMDAIVDAANDATSGEPVRDDASLARLRPDALEDHLRHLQDSIAAECTVDGYLGAAYGRGGAITGATTDLGPLTGSFAGGGFTGDLGAYTAGEPFGDFDLPRFVGDRSDGGFVAGWISRINGRRGVVVGLHGTCTSEPASVLADWYGDLSGW